MKRRLPPRPHQRLLKAIRSRRTRQPIEATVERPSLLRRLLVPGWENLVPSLIGEEGVERQRAQEWELVLQSRHIPCRTRNNPESGWALLVQPWFLERAVGELRLYLDENQPVPQPPVLPPPRPGELLPTLLLMAFLSMFYAWYVSPHPSMNLYVSRWLAAGSAHAGSILDGQWYRLVTALTLHGDGPHLVGNVVIGSLFIVLGCRLLGSGLGWLLVLCSGVLGNLVNALVLVPSHDSIGFSTAVFGAAGILSGVRLAEGGGSVAKRALVPVGSGLGILAMLGTGGENTDLGAHLFGFVVGIVLGWPAGMVAVRHGRPGHVANAAMLAVTLLVPVACWMLAMR